MNILPKSNQSEATPTSSPLGFEWFMPESVVQGGEDLRRRARLLTLWSLILGFIGLISIPTVWIYQGGATHLLVGILPATVVALTIPFVLRLTDSFYLAAVLLLCNLMMSNLFMAMVMGEGVFPLVAWGPLAWNVLVPLLAGFLLSPNHALSFGALMVLEYLVLFAVQLGLSDTITASSAQYQALLDFFSRVSLIGFVAYLAFVYERARLESEARADAAMSVLSATNQALDSARQIAEEASRAKSDFLARMSHELRTPINGVLGMNELLLASPLNNEQRESCLTVRDSASALLGLVNDTLSLGEAGSGQLRLQPCSFDPKEAILGAAQLLSYSAEAKQLSLHWEVGEGVPTRFCSDPRRIRQILLNLLGNAVKYTDEGSVTIRIEGTKTTPAGLRFEVQDTGIGVNQADHEQLFEPFFQAESPWTRRFGGMGLGLAIARDLCSLLGGQIGRADRSGGGSIFWLELPSMPEKDKKEHSKAPEMHTPDSGTTKTLRLNPAEQPTPVSAPGPRASHPSRILVVEDNEVNRRLAVQMLERLGYEVESANNGREAVKVCKGKDFDLILMDCQMPEMDGFEAAAELRKLQRTGNPLRIIAATASTLSEERQRCIDAGMDDFIAKPYMPRQLAEVVAGWL